MDKSKIEAYTHYWNPLVMQVLTKSDKHPQSTLFGITGDIDNLGIYVAKNGRAKAENLVDLYNQIIRNEIIRWARANCDSLDDYAFVASGEEILVLGVTRDKSIVESMFLDFNSKFNRLLRDNPYIDIGETGISFGCSFLENGNLKKKIKKMTAVIEGITGEDEFELYLEILEHIRNTLAHELDKVKFRTLFHSVEGNEIVYRNFVYAHLLQYKYNTAESLKVLSECFASLEGGSDRSSLHGSYGLNDKNRRLAFELMEKIEKLKAGN